MKTLQPLAGDYSQFLVETGISNNKEITESVKGVLRGCPRHLRGGHRV